MADVELTITAINGHVPLILEAMAHYAEKTLAIEGQSDRSSRFEFTYPAKGSDSNKIWAEKFIKQLVRAVVRMYKLREDTIRYSEDINDVQPPSQSVPDEIVE
ncbi:hypothetical protein KAR91_27810 [Candidatus Pacearchaeota archaeon]|nr:hypothetical protein [Candidatus Pacearchaeota archaeon]